MRWILIAVGLFVAGACSAAHVDDIEPLALEEVCPRITEALRSGRAACCASLDDFYLTDEELQQRVSESCDRFFPHTHLEPYQPLDMAFDGRAAARLIARFEDAASTCNIPPLVASVQSLLSPHLREGDRCVDDRECPAELACIPDSTDAIEVRHCKAPAQVEGAPCLAEAHCSPDFGCRAPDGTATGTCDKAQLGERCIDMPCITGLLCKMEYSVATACVVPGTLGAPCTRVIGFTGCAEGFYCREDPLSNETCGERTADGTTCTNADSCRSNVCVLTSSVSGQCTACSSDNCDGECVDGTCVMAAPRFVHGASQRPRWPPVQYDFRADREACSFSEDCAGGSCQSQDCTDDGCDRVCESLPTQAIWCQVAIYSRTQRW